MSSPDLYVRILAAEWLDKVQIFSPKNIAQVSGYNKDWNNFDRVAEWGYYSIANNIYPNLWEIIMENSPTAATVTKHVTHFIAGNIPKEIKNKFTTLSKNYSDTFYSQVRNLALDCVKFEGSCAFWVGYGKNNRINQFKQLPISWLRYYSPSQEEVGLLGADKMIIRSINGQFDRSLGKNDCGRQLFFSYNPDPAVVSAQKEIVEGYASEYCNLHHGQVLWYNPANLNIYPNCTFDNLLQCLLSDIALTTGQLSYLTHGEIGKIYKKNSDLSGAESAVNQLLNSAAFTSAFPDISGGTWGAIRDSAAAVASANISEGLTPLWGNNAENTGVKAMGSSSSERKMPNEGSIQNNIMQLDMVKFQAEFDLIQATITKHICNRLMVPAEYIDGLKSGAVTQTNMDSMIAQMNLTFENDRDTLENLLNTTVLNPEISDINFQCKILAYGEGKQGVNADFSASASAVNDKKNTGFLNRLLK